MTRENKLALVVGFGLILFVGILISDHFSTVRTQRAADFTRVALNNPSDTSRESDPLLIDLRPPIQQSQPAISPTTLERQPENSEPSPASPPAEPTEVRMAGPSETPPGFVEVDADSQADPAGVKLHLVRPGESLFAICRQYYRDPNKVDALAHFNNIDEPSDLRAGHQLRIPPPQELGGDATPIERATASPAPTTDLPIKVVRNNTIPVPTTRPRPAVTYTVQAGDSLRQIAQRVYGSKSKWKKLHDLNRHVIDDPDNLKVGTVLRLS
ncbi:MAG: LysM peptidoglycan-binding domain-containing protein [Phycisphaerales bacterium]|nr:LysM peptidoglycan-binding domain-containing protein [Phycisphaerales bacterium]